MATFLSFVSTTPHLNSKRRHTPIPRPNYRLKICRIECNGQNPTSNSSTKQDSEPENALLKAAWYGSELLGIAASFFRPPSNVEAPGSIVELAGDGSGALDRKLVVETIKEDFNRSYFVTGNLTLNAYEEDCEFADPAGSFRGLRRFKRNCTNFGSLLEKSNMKLMRWEDFEDKGVGHWRFSCILSFPWRPILSGMFILTLFLANFMFLCIKVSNQRLNGNWEFIDAICRQISSEDINQLDTQSTILMKNPEKYAGMPSTGMFPKWCY